MREWQDWQIEMILRNSDSESTLLHTHTKNAENFNQIWWWWWSAWWFKLIALLSHTTNLQELLKWINGYDVGQLFSCIWCETWQSHDNSTYEIIMGMYMIHVYSVMMTNGPPRGYNPIPSISDLIQRGKNNMNRSDWNEMWLIANDSITIHVISNQSVVCDDKADINYPVRIRWKSWYIEWSDTTDNSMFKRNISAITTTRLLSNNKGIFEGEKHGFH